MKNLTNIKKTILIGLFSILCVVAKGQYIDNYGLKIGVGLSNQYREIKDDMFSYLSGWGDNKIGFAGQFYAEKYIGKYLSIRPIIGYLQKGYIDEITIGSSEGEEYVMKDLKVFFNELR